MYRDIATSRRCLGVLIVGALAGMAAIVPAAAQSVTSGRINGIVL